MTQEEAEKAAGRLIKEANRKSDVERRAHEREKHEAVCDAAARRTARSSILATILEELKTKFDDAIAEIQSELDEKLDELYASVTEPEDPSDPGPGIDTGEAPYEVDYSLPMRERYIAVRDYYLGYEDKEEALSDLLQDEIAEDYLGAYYSYVQQLLMTMV